MFPVGITVTFLFVVYQKSGNSSKVLLLWQLQGAQCRCLLALCSVTSHLPLELEDCCLQGWCLQAQPRLLQSTDRCLNEHSVPVT